MVNKMTRYFQTAAFIVILAVLYFCAGSFGLSLARVHPSASAVWPPSGIALAAILLWGPRLWPGIFLGAFLVNINAPGSLATALSIAAGNTLEALLGAALVSRFANGANAFEQTKNLLRFILLAGFLSTAVAAAIGVTSLSLGGFARWDEFSTIWLHWWLGDMVGDLIVAPLLLLWLTQPFLSIKAIQILEAAGLLLTLVFVGWLLFLNTIPSGLEYFALAPLLWGALRFGRRGAITSTFIMSGSPFGEHYKAWVHLWLLGRMNPFFSTAVHGDPHRNDLGNGKRDVRAQALRAKAPYQGCSESGPG